MKLMEKRIILNLPSSLYEDIKRISQREYKSVSGFIRETVSDKIRDEFTDEETAIIEAGRRDFRKGRGINWRDVKRG